ncbi:MAG: hypothetical protein SGILL_005627, partial [Bacillariaceae sp.]
SMKDLSRKVVGALKHSGFLLVKSPLVLPMDLQQSAIRATQEIFGREDNFGDDDDEDDKGSDDDDNTEMLDNKSGTSNTKRKRDESLPLSQSFSEGKIVKHPTDPKAYCMLDCHSRETLEADLPPTASDANVRTLGEYAEALENVKVQLLECIAVGLDLIERRQLVNLHQNRNSVLRLLHYYSVAGSTTGCSSNNNKPMDIEDLTGDAPNNDQSASASAAAAASSFEPTIRCKAHSDYGSITLLLTDGTPGLQAFVNDQWIPVPHVPGALAVNIGSLLSEWTQGRLLATLHRVVSDPFSTGDSRKQHGQTTRTSLAYFADPDKDVATKLGETGKMKIATKTTRSPSSSSMSVADYIQYRSGGTGSTREGVQFTAKEKGRLQGNNSSNSMSKATNATRRGTSKPVQKKKEVMQQEEPEPPEVVLAAWKAALEVFVHELLYTRKVYPRDSFCKSRFLGVQCHLCRHPAVVSYISDALEVVVPSLISDSDSQELVLEIYDQTELETFEEFYISFSPHAKMKNGKVIDSSSHRLEEVEQELRDLICSVGRVSRCAPTRWPDTVSFKLVLQEIKGISISNHKSPSSSGLKKAMEEGKWYRANRPEEHTKETRRPIYDIPNTGCSFQYQLIRSSLR